MCATLSDLTSKNAAATAKSAPSAAFSQKQHFLRLAVSSTNEKFQNARTKCSLNRVENALGQSDCALQRGFSQKQIPKNS
jgi:hypothetical protein